MVLLSVVLNSEQNNPIVLLLHMFLDKGTVVMTSTSERALYVLSLTSPIMPSCLA